MNLPRGFRDQGNTVIIGKKKEKENTNIAGNGNKSRVSDTLGNTEHHNRKRLLRNREDAQKILFEALIKAESRGG